MAAFMTWRISAEMPAHGPAEAAGDGAVTLQLPELVREPFSAAMSQSVLLPGFIALFGIVAALFLVGFAPAAMARRRRRGARNGPVLQVYDIENHGYDDDDYVEVILRREPDTGFQPGAAINPAYEEESDTEPLEERVQHPRPAPADAYHSDPVDPWHSLVDDPVPEAQQIGFAHNGSHAENERRLLPIAEFAPRRSESAPHGDWLAPPSEKRVNGSARHHLTEGEAPRGQHYHPDPDDDPTSCGRHSSA